MPLPYVLSTQKLNRLPIAQSISKVIELCSSLNQALPDVIDAGDDLRSHPPTPKTREMPRRDGCIQPFPLR